MHMAHTVVVIILNSMFQVDICSRRGPLKCLLSQCKQASVFTRLGQPLKAIFFRRMISGKMLCSCNNFL